VVFLAKEDKTKKLKEEIDLLKLQLKARETEIEELNRKLEELHKSISYRVGRWIAERWWGRRLKGFLRKYVWK
jgi:chaperonin cofactor prefoldin